MSLKLIFESNYRQSTCAFEVIDVSDSEDEEVALAIEASLASAGQTKERYSITCFIRHRLVPP